MMVAFVQFGEYDIEITGLYYVVLFTFLEYAHNEGFYNDILTVFGSFRSHFF